MNALYRFLGVCVPAAYHINAGIKYDDYRGNFRDDFDYI